MIDFVPQSDSDSPKNLVTKLLKRITIVAIKILVSYKSISYPNLWNKKNHVVWFRHF